MKTCWFISDLHLGHSNILTYSKDVRPFASVELLTALDEKHLTGAQIHEDLYSELNTALDIHNEFIVDRINQFVKPTDSLWILGDVCYGRKEDIKYVKDIVCRNKKLVLGNHDTLPMATYTDVGFSKIYGMVRHKEFVLTHAPVHTQQLGRYRANIHGHLHTCDIDDPRYVNVNVDRTNCTPISLQQIREILTEEK